MNLKRMPMICFAAALTLSSVVSAQQFSIDWYTIDDGGGTSAGPEFAVSGTIGQPDAGISMTGPSFSLTGGFWSAVQTAGAPLLTIRFTSGNRALVSWPSASAGFTVQENANLNTANWVTPSEAVTDDGTNKFIIVNSPTGNRFYRLIKP